MASSTKRPSSNAASKFSTSKKRRFVTSCSECHRRKQRCNREKPCNFCHSRHVPELCTYALPISPDEKDHDAANSELKPGEDIRPSDDSSSPTNIINQAGYSHLVAPNSYTVLPKLIQSEGNSIASSPHSLDARIYDKFKQTYNSLLRQLPTRTICDELVDVYLEEVNWYYMSLEGHYFRELYGDWIAKGEYLAKNENFNEMSRDLQYFPALLFQVLANAVEYASSNYQCTSLLGLDDEDRRNSLSLHYSERGVEVMALLGRSNPTITAVQHDLVRCEWLKNNSRGTDSWHSLGSAIRLGQEIGLHIQSNVVQDSNNIEATLQRMWYEEYRRRLWARLFTLDAHNAVMLGRPRMIHRDDCDMKPLLDCDIPEEPFRVIPIPTSMQAEPSSHPIHIHLLALSNKYHDMLRPEIRTPRTLHYDEVKSIHQEVNGYLDNLPAHMRPKEPDTSWDERKPHFPKGRAHIKSTTNVFLMNLHRPHVSTRPFSRQAALEAALNVLNAQQELFQHISIHQYKTYGLWFPTLDAGLFLSSMVIDQPPQDTDLIERTHTAIQQAIQRLGKLKQRSSAARSGEQILKQCYHQIQEVVGLPPSIIEDETSTTTRQTPGSSSNDIQQQAYPSTNTLEIASTSTRSQAQQDFVPQISNLSSIPPPQDLSHDYLSGLWDTGGTIYGSTASSSVFDTYLATQLSFNGYVWPNTTTTNYPPS